MDAVGDGQRDVVVHARARARRTGSGPGDESTAVLANVDRTTADVAAAALLSYGIEARTVAKPGAATGDVRGPIPRTAPVHGVIVRRRELALARDVLRRGAQQLPDEFRDEEVEAWSAARVATHDRGVTRMAVVGAMVAVGFVVVVLLAAVAIAALG